MSVKELVRSATATPTVEDFASTAGTPIVVNRTNANAYVLNSSEVVKLIGGATVDGSAVTGGTANCVLYVDGSGNLEASDTDFQFDGSHLTAKGLATFGGNSATSSGIIIKGNGGVQSGYFVPLSTHIASGTSLDPVIASDSATGNIRFYTGVDARGTLTSAGQLDLMTPGSLAGLLLGGDAQIYRSAADTLRTPDKLVVDQTFESSNYPLLPPYDVGWTFNGILGDSEEFRFRAGRPFTLPASLTNSQAVAEDAATGSSTFTITKNGSSIGSFNFAIAATTATFTFASNVAFAIGDLLKITGPATADATLADLDITLIGYRS